MALLLPILPQLVNGIITTNQISADNGIIVQIPTYGNVSLNDTIKLYFNGILVETYLVINVSDLPKLFMIPRNISTLGTKSVYYSVTDKVQNMSESPRVNFNVSQSQTTADYLLTPTIIVNNSQANNVNYNIILYTLSSPTGASVSNVYLLFEALGGGTLGAAYGATNANGQYQLTVRSGAVGSVLVQAKVSLDATVITFTDLNFVAVPVAYQLTTSIISNNNSADGQHANVIQARLVNANTGQGIAGQPLLVYVSGPATYPSTIITNATGYVSIYITTNTPGTLTVSVYLEANTSISSSQNINFTVTYPIVLGSRTVWLQHDVGIQKLLGPYNLTAFNRYTIETTREPSTVWNCQNNQAFNIATTSCTIGIERAFYFLDDDLSDVVPLRTASGANLSSERVMWFAPANSGYGVVTIKDWGPQNAAAFDPALLEQLEAEQIAERDAPKEETVSDELTEPTGLPTRALSSEQEALPQLTGQPGAGESGSS
ncbi:Ig-like domain-containing protein [Sodalis sp. RH21]|uniref:Ig-like domain-containing protein n=1 Tax=unclassified Sodalis (in: enterobacteria) TaxID=2636512 RepID=UPI0039B56A93